MSKDQPTQKDLFGEESSAQKKRTGRPRTWTGDPAMALQLHGQGLTPKEISTQTTIPIYAVNRILREARGYSLFTPRAFTADERVFAVQSYRDGQSGLDIAAALNTSHPQVYRMLDQAGILRRKYTKKKIPTTKRCTVCGKEKDRATGFFVSTWKKTGKVVTSGPCRECTVPIAKNLAKRRRIALRQEMILAYGGSCICCGESKKEFLSIDHIHGGGGKERKSRGSGSSFYDWLRKKGWPKDDYQLLCFCCNLSRGFYGYCPCNGNLPQEEDILTPGKKEYRSLRKKVIDGYGGKCVCCDRAEFCFLAVDHVAGGGSAERRAGLSSSSRYRELIRDNFPPKARLLCHNCNSSIGFFGYCPHGKDRQGS